MNRNPIRMPMAEMMLLKHPEKNNPVQLSITAAAMLIPKRRSTVCLCMPFELRRRFLLGVVAVICSKRIAVAVVHGDDGHIFSEAAFLYSYFMSVRRLYIVIHLPDLDRSRTEPRPAYRQTVPDKILPDFSDIFMCSVEDQSAVFQY